MISSGRVDAPVIIIGGGILGSSLAYWLSSLYEPGSVVLVDQEDEYGRHASSRNTGVIHRPFYLNPSIRPIFARASQISYDFWREFTREHHLPWNPVGTIELAVQQEDIARLEKYQQWAVTNGMHPDELEMRNGSSLSSIAPGVHAAAGLLVRTDTSVDFGACTRTMAGIAQANGVECISSVRIDAVREHVDGVVVEGTRGFGRRASFVINCAGANGLMLARAMGVHQGLVDIFFRGDYWILDPKSVAGITSNLYTIPRHPDFPFLDPHIIARWDGTMMIGPTAVPVVGPYAYEHLVQDTGSVIRLMRHGFSAGFWKLLFNQQFLQLASQEWKSTFSVNAFIDRVRHFFPSLERRHLLRPGLPGIRGSLVDESGSFIKEALARSTPHSLHILNYNSPGATGAPAYTASIVDRLERQGVLACLQKRSIPLQIAGEYHSIASQMHSQMRR